MRTPALASAALAALLLSACTTPAYVSPVEVTRFTGAAPAQLGRGPITVVAAPGDVGADSLEFSLYRNAVAAELGRLGYTVTGGTSAGGQVAEIVLERGVNAPLTTDRQGPVSVGVGGGTGGYGSGLGVGIGINLGGGGSRDTEELYRQLRVIIRSGTTPLWEGRANFTASSNSDYAGEQAAAGRLAQALFQGFPGESGATIEVR
ncbi:hypothetical protein PK98_14280 [Croceibacterium mercuriale]|uniref:DUF4136 domain-containing protein n=1 Tax=Croceibacterium mercuriale TaxID=1572751 RepID=A0A0B2BYS2_9SPHN|nr:hypothetical protein [Croceibacterium mercuriale]KHL25000.1 hypothetical protein PK98_14280 [Croceibacterium mercuriale]